jgi:peptide/nickel transport system permease protein
MVLLALVGLIGPFVVSDPNHQDLTQGLLPPGSPGHFLGTDALGRDLTSWVINGIRTSFEISLAVVTLSGFVGVLVGLVTGYFGGIVDSVLMRVVDLSLAVPPLLLFIAAAATIVPTEWSLILLLSAVAWIPYARLVRARVLTARERGFVAASRLAGSGHARVMMTHVLPVVSTTPIVLMSLQFGYVLLWESGLSFLGLGIRPPQASLGYMISQGVETMKSAWWVVVIPGLVIVAIVTAANLLGEGLRRLIQEG